MNRRNFITVFTGAAAAWLLAAHAQKTAALIGFLISGAADSFAIFVEAFKQGMRDNGMVEDRNYVLDLHYADGDYGRFQTLAAEAVERKPAVIVVTRARRSAPAQRYRL
jgi:putative ABC transport system substrate-binding protein